VGHAPEPNGRANFASSTGTFCLTWSKWMSQRSIRPGNNQVAEELVRHRMFCSHRSRSGWIKTEGRRGKNATAGATARSAGRNTTPGAGQTSSWQITGSRRAHYPFCSYDFQFLEDLPHIDRELQIGVQLRAFDVRLRHIANRASRGPEPSVLTIKYRWSCLPRPDAQSWPVGTDFWREFRQERQARRRR